MTLARIGNAYVEWAQRRSEPIRVLLFWTTLFLFLGIVVPLIDLAGWIASKTNRGEAE